MHMRAAAQGAGHKRGSIVHRIERTNVSRAVHLDQRAAAAGESIGPPVFAVLRTKDKDDAFIRGIGRRDPASRPIRSFEKNLNFLGIDMDPFDTLAVKLSIGANIIDDPFSIR